MSDRKKRSAAGAIEEEEAFVRGGGSGLAPIVKKQLEQVRFSVVMCALIRQSATKRMHAATARMPITARTSCGALGEANWASKGIPL